MNRWDALHLLELNASNPIPTLEDIKKQYKRIALKHHPDKNGNTATSNERFQKINEAYVFLKEDWERKEDKKLSPEEPFSLYRDLLQHFLQSSLGTSNHHLFHILANLILGTTTLTAQLLEEWDRTTALQIYTFLSKNRSYLHLPDALLETIRAWVVQKYERVEIYVLNPTIQDMLDGNCYKLYIGEELLYVPLWHRECYFDVSGCEIIVLCEPELPPNVSLDEDNNLYVSVKYEWKKIFQDDDVATHLTFFLGNAWMRIPFSQLHIQREQVYKMCGAGLAKMNDNVLDIGERKDIYVNIQFV
jgi:hypothetical protein